MRLIDADALNKKLKTVPKDFVRNMIPYESVIGMIDLMQTVGGWISVKDRLPEYGGLYLVTCRDGAVCLALYDREHKNWFHEDLGDLDVTYYMLLPEPPEEDKDG